MTCVRRTDRSSSWKNGHMFDEHLGAPGKIVSVRRPDMVPLEKCFLLNEQKELPGKSYKGCSWKNVTEFEKWSDCFYRMELIILGLRELL